MLNVLGAWDVNLNYKAALGPGGTQTRAIDFSMNGALRNVGESWLRTKRIPVEIVLDDVAGGHKSRRKVATHQEALRIGAVPHADVTEGIDNLLIRQNTIGGDEIIKHLGGNVDHMFRHKSLLNRSLNSGAMIAIPLTPKEESLIPLAR